MPEIHVNDCNLYYEIHGQGTPLILIMGLRRNLEWWYNQIPVLSEHFKVIVFDNRGAGRSDKPETEYSIPLFADDTAALMDGLGIDRAHVLGFSMGGYIAQELAINYPEKIEKLALVSTSCGGSKAVLMSDERMKTFTANQGLTPEEILRKDMDIYFSDAFIKANSQKIEKFTEISMRYYQPAHAFLRQFDACLKHDTVERLHHITAPVLVMTGGDDPLVPTENSHILKTLMPDAGLSVFPNGRHCFIMEFADRFNAEVISFFNS